ncbi:MAG: hypothetical protein KKB70_09290 [Proteobacteria bacterium]|nr:hypothetical protein [Pseudomonadota bacterium]MBU1612132.1 hypothetical protein [Pseudomonadota bacterium]
MNEHTLIRLPGLGCEHYRQSRCFYAEHLNPGYEERHRCPIVVRWADRLEDFYLRAEAMGLEEERLKPLWEARSRDMLPEMRRCRWFVSGSHLLGCANLHELLCLQALPVCQGRCSHYRLAKGEDQHDAT